MHQDAIQKRKARNLLSKLSFSFGIFLLSLLLCALIFGWGYLKKPVMLSPLSSVSAKNAPASDNEGEKAVYDIKRFCEGQRLSCSSVTAQGETITILLVNNAQILVSTKKDLQKQLASLQLTINQLTIEGKQFKKLDFRFDEVVAIF